MCHLPCPPLPPSLGLSIQVIMKDKWMNIGFEDDELRPYDEPEPDLDDKARIRTSITVTSHLHVVIVCAIYRGYRWGYVHDWISVHTICTETLMAPPLPHTHTHIRGGVTERMLQMGFTLKEIQDSLSENRYDEVCATYMLLARNLHVSSVSH